MSDESFRSFNVFEVLAWELWGHWLRKWLLLVAGSQVARCNKGSMELSQRAICLDRLWQLIEAQSPVRKGKFPYRDGTSAFRIRLECRSQDQLHRCSARFSEDI